MVTEVTSSNLAMFEFFISLAILTTCNLTYALTVLSLC